MSYKVADNFSIGGGLRLIYSEGKVKSDGTASSCMVISREIWMGIHLNLAIT